MSAKVASCRPRSLFGTRSITLFALGFLLFAASAGLHAAAIFYVDSHWTGAQSGSAAQPWTYLSSSAWTSINNALAGGNVTVYFAARPASSDTDDLYDTNGDGIQDGIDLSKRSDTGGSVLTLDGNSQYNTSAASPSWLSYSGKSKCRIGYLTAQNASHVKYSNITIHGFHVATLDGNKEIGICGDNWVIENCECEHTSTSSNGPGILLVPTSDSAHEGSSYYAPACTNITIRNNIVHDTYGEALYIGGGGIMDGTAAAGYPSHSYITIESNIVYNAGTWGAQGDGIDVKGGIRYLTIRANEIYNINSTAGVRAIVVQGQLAGAAQTTIVERNRIHDCAAIEDAAIAVVNSWGTPQGVTIRNNLIYNINGPSGASGIKVYDSQDAVRIYNNTISSCAASGILVVSAPQVVVMNNLVFGNNSGGSQVSLSASSVQCDYNAYGGNWGYSSPGGSSLSLSATALISTVVSAATGDYRLQAGSPVIGKATVLSGFSNDVASNLRGTSWDTGAYQHTSLVLQAPAAPTNFRVVGQ